MTESTPQLGAVVDLDQVGFAYGKRTVLDGLSLQVQQGSIFGLLGANGAGKTTLLRLLLGTLEPKSGSLQVLGESHPLRIARRIGYMPQLNAIYLELSVQQNVDFFARMFGMASSKPRHSAVESALKVVGLWDRRDDQVLLLSGGMRQRVSLAIALVHQPPLLLLDEPTVGLDPELRATFWDHFRELATSGTTIILSSHTMDDAAHCDQLAFIQEGRVVAQGSPAELRTAAGGPEATLEDAFLHFIRLGQSQ